MRAFCSSVAPFPAFIWADRIAALRDPSIISALRTDNSPSRDEIADSDALKAAALSLFALAASIAACFTSKSFTARFPISLLCASDASPDAAICAARAAALRAPFLFASSRTAISLPSRSMILAALLASSAALAIDLPDLSADFSSPEKLSAALPAPSPIPSSDSMACRPA